MSTQSIHTRFTSPSLAAIRAARATHAHPFVIIQNHIHIKPKRLRLLLPAALLCALFSCSKNLTREEAAEAIIKHYDYPNVDIMRLADGGPKSHLEHSPYGNSTKIGYSSDVIFNEGRTFDTHRFGLTEKGLSFVAPEAACDAHLGEVPSYMKGLPWPCVATNIWEFKHVTGIAGSEDGSTAAVEYVVVATRVNTFGGYVGRKEGQEETRKASMKRYDDGSWRVEDPKPVYVVKPDDIPAYANKNNNR